MNFLRLGQAETSTAGGLKKLGKFFGADGKHLFWRGVLGQKFHGRSAKGIGEELFVLGENLVEQCKNLAFEIGGHVDDVKALAAQFPHGLQVAGVARKFRSSGRSV